MEILNRSLQQLLTEIHDMLADWSTADFSTIPPSPAPSSSTSTTPALSEPSAPLQTYFALKDHSAEFQAYKQSQKRGWVSEKSDLAMLFGNIQTKLKTYGLREYVPPPGLSIGVSEGRALLLLHLDRRVCVAFGMEWILLTFSINTLWTGRGFRVEQLACRRGATIAWDQCADTRVSSEVY